MRKSDKFQSLNLEPLESRVLLSTFYVANGGSDSAAGTSSAPWSTLQHAANSVHAGDTVNVRAGNYKGMVLGWDAPTNGTSSAPITFKAEPGATITSRNNKTADGINLEGASYIIIDGFTVNNADGSIIRAGIRSVQNNHVIIRNNITTNNGAWGIFSSNSSDIRVENNRTSNNNADTSNNWNHHGMYMSGSARPVIRNNIVYGNIGNGLHFNEGVSGALVEGNIIYNNASSAGSAINGDGLRNSIIRNNLLYNNDRKGICVYRIDSSNTPDNNIIVNNTIVMRSGNAIAIRDGGSGNQIRNNILLGGSGSFSIDSDCYGGLVSDYNVITAKAGSSTDSHSIFSDASSLFVDPANRNYHLKSGAPAIDKGTSTTAPSVDLEGKARPAGAGYDIGAYEYGSTTSTTPTPTPTPTATWDNHAITSQSGNFNFEFDAKPTQSSEDVVIGLSNSAASQYSDLAAIVRFNSSGTIDARNGSTYAAATSLTYSANTSYHFKLVVRTAQHQYDIYVTPQGGTQTLLGQNYAFRTEQASVTSLANWAKYNNTGDATVSNAAVSSATAPTGTGNGLTAQYFDNSDFTNLKVTRVDPTVNFDWAYSSPDASIAPDTFSARWTGKVLPTISGTYTFSTTSDDGVRLWVNGQQLVNNWTDHGATTNSGSIALQAGQKYDIKMEYYDNAGRAVAKLYWAAPNQPLQPIPTSQLFSA